LGMSHELGNSEEKNFTAEDAEITEMQRRLGDFEAAFEEGEQGVGDDCEKGGGDCAGEDYGVADHGDTAKDEGAEAAGADGGGDGGHADCDDG
jgi:hypothetical protein